MIGRDIIANKTIWAIGPASLIRVQSNNNSLGPRTVTQRPGHRQPPLPPAPCSCSKGWNVCMTVYTTMENMSNAERRLRWRVNDDRMQRADSLMRKAIRAHPTAYSDVEMDMVGHVAVPLHGQGSKKESNAPLDLVGCVRALSSGASTPQNWVRSAKCARQVLGRDSCV